MKYMKWIGLMAVILLVVSCFTPWVIIESKNIIVSGIDAAGTNFGKPGYMHFVFAFLFTVFHFINKIWAKRWNLMVVGLNTAWAARNFFVLTACRGGECPEQQSGLYIMLLASGLVLVSALFPDISLKKNTK